jgi:hypothetical protein
VRDVNSKDSILTRQAKAKANADVDMRRNSSGTRGAVRRDRDVCESGDGGLNERLAREPSLCFDVEHADAAPENGTVDDAVAEQRMCPYQQRPRMAVAGARPQRTRSTGRHRIELHQGQGQHSFWTRCRSGVNASADRAEWTGALRRRPGAQARRQEDAILE